MLEIDSRIIPQRLKNMALWATVNSVISVVLVAIDFYSTSEIIRLGKDYKEDIGISLLTIATLVFSIVSFVYMAKGLNNISHYMRTKNGDDYLIAKSRSAGVWLWFVPFGTLFLKNTVTPKVEDETFLSKNAFIVRTAMLWMFAGIIVDNISGRMMSAANTDDVLWNASIAGAVATVFTIVGNWNLRNYAVAVEKDLEAYPSNYPVNAGV